MDISQFKVGEYFKDGPGFIYEVLKLEYSVNKKKRYIVASTCKNISTGSEVRVSWGIGKNIRFEKYLL